MKTKNKSNPFPDDQNQSDQDQNDPLDMGLGTNLPNSQIQGSVPTQSSPGSFEQTDSGQNPPAQTTSQDSFDQDGAELYISPGPQIIFAPLPRRPTASLMKIAKPIESNQHISTSRARSAKTEAQYRERVKGLYRQSSEIRTLDPQHPVEPSPLEVTNDLIESASHGPLGEPPVRAHASWALYRASLLWHLASRRNENPAYEEAYQVLANTKNPSGLNKSATKNAKKTFAGNDFKILINTLGQLDSKNVHWGSKTACWMQAGVAAGARGGEWEATSWLDKAKFQLLIPNGKRKVSKPAFMKMAVASGDSVKSVFDLDDDAQLQLEDDEQNEEDNNRLERNSHRIVRIDRNDAIYVHSHMASIAYHTLLQGQNGISPSDAFIHYYEMVRRTLRRACEIAFKGKKYYRLYDTRSQFSANKKVDHQLGAVAAMMGHLETRTTMSNYGSRADGLKSRKFQSEMLGQTTSFDTSESNSFSFFSDSQNWTDDMGDFLP